MNRATVTPAGRLAGRSCRIVLRRTDNRGSAVPPAGSARSIRCVGCRSRRPVRRSSRSTAPTARSVIGAPTHSMMSSGWAATGFAAADVGSPVGRARGDHRARRRSPAAERSSTTVDTARSRAARTYSGSRVSRADVGQQAEASAFGVHRSQQHRRDADRQSRRSRRSRPPTRSAPRSDQLLGGLAGGADVHARDGVELQRRSSSANTGAAEANSLRAMASNCMYSARVPVAWCRKRRSSRLTAAAGRCSGQVHRRGSARRWPAHRAREAPLEQFVARRTDQRAGRGAVGPAS